MDHTSCIDVKLPTPWPKPAPETDEERAVLAWTEEAFYLDLGHVCNQQCLYCSQRYQESRFLTREEYTQPIDIAAKFGFRKVLLIGGEPLMHPEFDQVIETLHGKGFREWGVMSNGTLLADTERFNRWVDMGMRFCQISMDSAKPDEQARLSRNPKLYNALLGAFANIGQYPDFALIVNAVLTRVNVENLDKLVWLLSRLRKGNNIHPVMTITQMKPFPPDGMEWLVKASKAAEAVARAVELGKTLEQPVYYRNLPYCLLPGMEPFSTDWHTRLYRIFAEGSLMELPDMDMTKSAQCSKCALTHACPGYYAAYAEKFGDGEFLPRSEVPDGYRLDASEYSHPVLSGALESLRFIGRLSESKAGSGGEIRLAIGELDRTGNVSYLETRKVEDAVQAGSGVKKLVLTGPEPSLHPRLPELVRMVADFGFDVWLETTALAFDRQSRIDTLLDCGLKGIRWLHLPRKNEAIRRLLPKGLCGALRRKIADRLRNSRLAVEQALLLTDEDEEGFLSRLSALEKLSAENQTMLLTTRPFAESWGGWLRERPPDEKTLESRLQQARERLAGRELETDCSTQE